MSRVPVFSRRLVGNAGSIRAERRCLLRRVRTRVGVISDGDEDTDFVVTQLVVAIAIEAGAQQLLREASQPEVVNVVFESPSVRIGVQAGREGRGLSVVGVALRAEATSNEERGVSDSHRENDGTAACERACSRRAGQREGVAPVTMDEQWIHALADGSHDAFEKVFDTYADFVFNVAYRRTQSVDVSEEIVADVFSELWRQRQDIVTKHGSLKPWLAGTAANRARRHWRSTDRKRRATVRLESQSKRHTEDVADATVSRIDDARRIGRVVSALSELPAEQFDVLTLSVWEELSHRDIAAALGIAVGTVKSRLSRARALLEVSVGTEMPLRAWPHDCPPGVVGGRPTIRTKGECS